MVKKLPIRFRMKKVIEALREGKKTWSELVKLSVPEKTLDRILKDYLLYWGLVRKEGEYYVWFEYSRVFKSKHDYGLAIEHSRKLIPAFKSMLNIAELDRAELYFSAKEHLRSYPEIYEKSEKFEELFNDRVRYLFQKYRHNIKTSDRFWVMHFEKRKGKGLFGKVFGETVLVKDDVPYMIDYGHPEIKDINELKKTKEYKEINELRDLLDNTKAFNEGFEVYRELAGDISLLILKIEMGEPLEGKCSLCPKIKIAEKGGEQSK